MKAFLLAAAISFFLLWNSYCTAEDSMPGLPRPHYHPEESDPDWLAAVVQFHGHLGPWAIAGIRFGMAGRKAVGADGYFDVAVECRGPLVRPPRSCFLDGLQVSTGATLGKRNLRSVEADSLVVRVENTQTGRKVEIRPTARLLEILGSLKPQPAGQRSDSSGPASPPDHAALERLAREIVAAADREILTVTPCGDRPGRSGESHKR